MWFRLNIPLFLDLNLQGENYVKTRHYLPLRAHFNIVLERQDGWNMHHIVSGSHSACRPCGTRNPLRPELGRYHHFLRTPCIYYYLLCEPSIGFLFFVIFIYQPATTLNDVCLPCSSETSMHRDVDRTPRSILSSTMASEFAIRIHSSYGCWIDLFIWWAFILL